MTVLHASSMVGWGLRLLMVAACTLPFATPRKLATAWGMPPPAVALGGQLPTAPAPVSEEDESERQGDVKAREAASRPDRRSDLSRNRTNRGGANFSFKKRPIDLSHFSHLRPTCADPFRNGLGTPFRC